MAERTVLVCDRCGTEKSVLVTHVTRAGKKLKAELCEKCFKEMSGTYGFGPSVRGWAKREVVDFDEIPRHSP